MTFTSLPLVSWSNGAFMIGVFALVCVILVAAILILVMGGNGKKNPN